jgi:hypothetical protein
MYSIPGHEWVLDHVLPVDDPLELFPIEMETV